MEERRGLAINGKRGRRSPKRITVRKKSFARTRNEYRIFALFSLVRASCRVTRPSVLLPPPSRIVESVVNFSGLAIPHACLAIYAGRGDSCTSNARYHQDRRHIFPRNCWMKNEILSSIEILGLQKSDHSMGSLAEGVIRSSDVKCHWLAAIKVSPQISIYPCWKASSHSPTYKLPSPPGTFQGRSMNIEKENVYPLKERHRLLGVISPASRGILKKFWSE